MSFICKHFARRCPQCSQRSGLILGMTGFGIMERHHRSVCYRGVDENEPHECCADSDFIHGCVKHAYEEAPTERLTNELLSEGSDEQLFRDVSLDTYDLAPLVDHAMETAGPKVFPKARAWIQRMLFRADPPEVEVRYTVFGLPVVPEESVPELQRSRKRDWIQGKIWGLHDGDTAES
eukprot:TRINITY_DN28138_c0_g4_i1.p1 TRINITY_DN28138_c0_g4~~TRINITY_DN28138_c0_g4_i1.p1  ORF type:complete len:178 (+),score=23.13 TRINITY_DN28138_c0_g4_i1:54-587(+)